MAQGGRWTIAVVVISVSLSVGGWGASMSGDVHTTIGRILEGIGVLGAVGSILWALWPRLRERLRVGRRPVPSPLPALLKRVGEVPPFFRPKGYYPAAYNVGERFGVKGWEAEEWIQTGAFVRIDREVALRDLGRAIATLRAVLDRLIADSAPPDDWEWGAALEEFGAAIGPAERFDKRAARAARKLRKIYAHLREEMQGYRRLPRFRQEARALEGWGRRFPGDADAL